MMDDAKTILVVDDDPDMHAIVKNILEAEGYRVITLWDCYELFAFLKMEQPSLMILDLMLPGMDGLSALRKLREFPSLSSVPVILATAKGSHKELIEGYQAGADYYISKPFTKSTLINGVKLVLEDGKEDVPKPHSAWLSPV